MKDEEKEKLERRREEINVKVKMLLKELKEAEAETDWDLAEKIDKQVEVLSKKQKYILWRLGLYKFPEDEMVEFRPGEYMSTEQYYWLLDE